jgi:phenylacetate-CoA ligase
MSLSSIAAKTVGMRIIDIARKTKALEVYKQLKATERLSIDELEALQFDRLGKLLMHCQQNVPFYQQQFREYDFNAENFHSPSDIECLPILTKDVIRTNFSELKAKNFERFRPRIKQTGGSTGQPLRLYHDELSHSTMWANIYRGFGFGGYELGDKYLIIASGSSGSLLPKKLRFCMPLYFFFQNSLVIPSYYLEQDYAKKIADLINKKKPKFIYGYSSSLSVFARSIAGSGEKVKGLEAIFTTADMLYPRQRKLIEETFGAPIFDNYGCPEAGLMTFECEVHDGYHYNMESCFIEIVDQDSDGVGRIISTNLTNYAFPIVRYDTGDVAAINREDHCSCGRSHNKVVSLLGRQRDILTLSNGRMVHGAFFNNFSTFYNNNFIERYQIIQTAIDQIEVHVQLEEGYSLDQLAHLTGELESVLDNLVEVTLIEGEFRESELSRKHRTVVSDVDNIWTGDEAAVR